MNLFTSNLSSIAVKIIAKLTNVGSYYKISNAKSGAIFCELNDYLFYSLGQCLNGTKSIVLIFLD